MSNSASQDVIDELNKLSTMAYEAWSMAVASRDLSSASGGSASREAGGWLAHCAVNKTDELARRLDELTCRVRAAQ